ncbi:MAG: hypothetical protein UV82_C0007G0001, partial [Candidatus Magasanikbacteria bacterium GW2011_GWD2_43_18]
IMAPLLYTDMVSDESLCKEAELGQRTIPAYAVT